MLNFWCIGLYVVGQPLKSVDSFQQLPWSLAEALNGLLQQRKINTVIGSSSAGD